MAQVDEKPVEQTYAQSVIVTRAAVDQGRAVLDKRLPATYATYRKIRKQPTVAFSRALCVAPVVSGQWSLECDDDVDDDRVRFVRDQIMPIREPFIEAAMLLGNVDYGWCPFEKVYAAGNWEGQQLTLLRRLKPLLVDLTDIVVDQETGKFAGFRQPVPSGIRSRDTWVNVDLDNALLINFRVEGDHHYGEPLLENLRKAYLNWDDANAGAERYDKKLAGAQWIVHYPGGSSKINGTDTPNDEVAREIVDSLEASASIVVPRKLVKWVEDLNQQAMSPPGVGDAWQIELKDHAAKQASFIDRMNYCDKQFVRGMLMPERSALEGEYGTKADAGVHANLALAIREIEHRHVTRLFQWHVLDQLLALNFGDDARNTIRVVASPLVDEKLAFFRELYKLVLAHPTASMDAFDELDIDALMDALGVPKASEVAFQDDESGLHGQLAAKLGELFQAGQRLNGVPANAPSGSRF